MFTSFAAIQGTNNAKDSVLSEVDLSEVDLSEVELGEVVLVDVVRLVRHVLSGVVKRQSCRQ